MRNLASDLPRFRVSPFSVGLMQQQCWFRVQTFYLLPGFINASSPLNSGRSPTNLSTLASQFHFLWRAWTVQVIQLKSSAFGTTLSPKKCRWISTGEDSTWWQNYAFPILHGQLWLLGTSFRVMTVSKQAWREATRNLIRKIEWNCESKCAHKAKETQDECQMEK